MGQAGAPETGLAQPSARERATVNTANQFFTNEFFMTLILILISTRHLKPTHQHFTAHYKRLPGAERYTSEPFGHFRFRAKSTCHAAELDVLLTIHKTFYFKYLAAIATNASRVCFTKSCKGSRRFRQNFTTCTGSNCFAARRHHARPVPTRTASFLRDVSKIPDEYLSNLGTSTFTFGLFAIPFPRSPGLESATRSARLG
jgi:hypothetical protein